MAVSSTEHAQVDDGSGLGDNGSELVARSTDSHCGGHAFWGWLASASLVATMGLVMCEMKAGQKAAATPMRTSAWKHGAYFFATSLVALAGAASSATSLVAFSLVASSLVALSATGTATAFLALT